MPTQALIAAHRKVQHAAKAALGELAEAICADDTEQSIAERAERALARRGLCQTWYYACPALVLLGPRTCESPSGRDYRPAAERVGESNLVTVDLSPSSDRYWGDCARTFFVEHGRVTRTPNSAEFTQGMAFLKQLHEAMRAFVQPHTTFHQLALWSAGRLAAAGFINLDFRGNVGHSIATHRTQRLYIEAGNHRGLGDVSFFTFEPHVRAVCGSWGFKHEDVFFFDARGALEEL
jgi:Xaa-Pro aminopeptidase